MNKETPARPIPVAQIESNSMCRAAMIIVFISVVIIGYGMLIWRTAIYFIKGVFNVPISLIKSGIKSWSKPVKTQ